jgi:hypothetical protein
LSASPACGCGSCAAPSVARLVLLAIDLGFALTLIVLIRRAGP